MMARILFGALLAIASAVVGVFAGGFIAAGPAPRRTLDAQIDVLGGVMVGAVIGLLIGAVAAWRLGPTRVRGAALGATLLAATLVGVTAWRRATLVSPRDPSATERR